MVTFCQEKKTCMIWSFESQRNFIKQELMEITRSALVRDFFGPFRDIKNSVGPCPVQDLFLKMNLFRDAPVFSIGMSP